MTITTCHGQTVVVGMQVAYATPVGASINPVRMYNNINISGGKLQVSTIREIEQTSAAWAEADASFKLTLANGDRVDLEDVCLTDGQYRYGGVVA